MTDGSWKSLTSARHTRFGDIRVSTPQTSFVERASSDAPGLPSSSPRGIVRRLCWRYIDFLTLYKGLSSSEIDAYWNVLGSASGELLEQCAIDLRTEIAAEADRRDVKIRDIEAELDARAAAADLPSATGEPRTGTSSRAEKRRQQRQVVGRGPHDLLDILGVDLSTCVR